MGFLASRVDNKHSFLAASLRAAMIPARHHAYVFLTSVNVETLRRIGRYRAAFDSVRGIFSKLSSIAMVEKAIACASSCFEMFFFSPKNAELMNRGLAVLHGWADKSTLTKEVLTQLNVSSSLPTESLLELSCFIRCTMPGEVVLFEEERRTLWNPIVNAGVTVADKRSIDDGNARYTSTMRLHQDCLEKDISCAWVVNKKSAARRLVCVDCSAAQHGCCIRRQTLGTAFWGSIFAG